MSETQIRIWPDLPKAKISPLIYGHATEHVGRSIYEGVWVGPKSKIPNDNGVRLDVLAALKQLRTPIMRWPGGHFANDYHWRSGIGPVSKRPETVNTYWRQTEPNSFGTDEFIQCCQAIQCEPFICVNVATGLPAEARNWLEYCNFGGDSNLAKMRAQNGNKAPYDVKYWAIGNNVNDTGGQFCVSDYAGEYARYAASMKALDPQIELVACGYSPDYAMPDLTHWNLNFCNKMARAELIDHISINRYFRRGTATDFSDEEYNNLFGDLAAMEHDLVQTDRILGYFYPDKNVGIAVGEWGIWHPEAVAENGLEQESTLRDAVFSGAILNLFNRHAHRVTMAHAAQTINALQCIAVTDEIQMLLNPTYYVFDMMRPHMGAQLLTHDVECEEYYAQPMGLAGEHQIPKLDISVSRSGKKILMTIANQTVDDDIEARIELNNVNIANATGRVLWSENPRDTNSFEYPKTVVPKRLKLEPEKNHLTHIFPAHSFTAISLTLG